MNRGLLSNALKMLAVTAGLMFAAPTVANALPSAGPASVAKSISASSPVTSVYWRRWHGYGWRPFFGVPFPFAYGYGYPYYGCNPYYYYGGCGYGYGYGYPGYYGGGWGGHGWRGGGWRGGGWHGGGFHGGFHGGGARRH